MLSGNFNQPRVARPPARRSAPTAARFFTNAIDTVTKGVEATARYRFTLGTDGSLGLSTQLQRSPRRRQRQRRTPTTRRRSWGRSTRPPQLAGLEATLFDRIERRRIECGQPKDNFRLGADWQKSALVGLAPRPAATASSAASRPTPRTTRSTPRSGWPTWTWPTATGASRVHVGAQNLFDEFADLNTPVNSFNGIQTYPSHSPFGMNGRFVYGRVSSSSDALLPHPCCSADAWKRVSETRRRAPRAGQLVGNVRDCPPDDCAWPRLSRLAVARRSATPGVRSSCLACRTAPRRALLPDPAPPRRHSQRARGQADEQLSRPRRARPSPTPLSAGSPASPG